MKVKDFLRTTNQSIVTRRDFVKYASSAAVGLFTMSNLAGCSFLKPSPDLHAYADCIDPNNVTSGLALGSNQVFESTVLGGIELKNRIFRSGTVLGLADKGGRPTRESIEKHVELAQGGVGAIITEGIAVQKNGVHIGLNPLLFDDDSNLEEYKKLTGAVHKYNTPIIMQVFHAGRQTRSIITGEPTIAPSPIRDDFFNEDTPKEMTDSQIEQVINKFVLAIERARKAEFDGVQLMAGHGYLLSEFLSPSMNHRKDRWGGSTENRFRIIREIYVKARKTVGDFPILIKMNAYDYQPGGMRLDESTKVAKLLENIGCDAIEVSCGVMSDGLSTIRVPEILTEPIAEHSFLLRDRSFITKKLMTYMMPLLVDLHEPIHNYNVCAAKEIKKNVNIPIVVVGGIRDHTVINQIISANMADYVAMSRPFIVEPDIVSSFKANQQSSSNCVSCGLCMFCLEKKPVECHYGTV
jgi:2,4-dienoyl-CoA reductase-like NADH-dependent reductase (Old Yellow Enzyme family)